MRPRYAIRSVGPALAACLTGLLVAGPGFAQQPAKGPAPKGASPKAEAKKAVPVRLKQEEIDTLRKAYLLMAEADADYDGHRARAMRHVQHAVEAIEGGKDHFVRWENERRKRKPLIIESQGRSDAQLRRAADLLRQVAKEMTQAHQRRLLAEVEKAIEEIGIALRVR